MVISLNMLRLYTVHLFTHEAVNTEELAMSYSETLGGNWTLKVAVCAVVWTWAWEERMGLGF